MKILTFTPIWGRPEIVHIFLENLFSNVPDYAEIEHCFIISPEDEYFDVFQKMLKGHHILIFKNDPLGEKKNAGLKFAMSLKWDYLIEFNSDSVYTPILWGLYKDLLYNCEKYFGINNLYFADVIKEKCIFVSNYHKMNETVPLGPGRVIHRSIIEDVGELWRNDWPCGMDGCSHFKIDKAGYTNTVIDVGRLPVMLDMKTRTNLNIFEEIENQPHDVVDYFEIMQKFNVHKTRSRQRYEITTFDGFNDAVIRLSGKCKKSDAFNSVNTLHELTFGEKRYKNYGSYQAYASRKKKV